MPLHRLGYLTILLAAIGSAPTAFAQSTIATTTTIEKRNEPVKLTPQQRTVVYRTVTRERRVAPPVDVEVRMGGSRSFCSRALTAAGQRLRRCPDTHAVQIFLREQSTCPCRS